MAQIPQFTTGTPALTDVIPFGQGINTRKAPISVFKALITEDVNASLSENVQNITNHVADLVTDSNGVHGLKISKGYFTPYWEGETTVGAPAYTQQKGYYTIIDKTLYFQAYLSWEHLGGAVGKMRLRGFPYACKNEAFRINIFALLSNSFKYDAYTNLVASMDNSLNYTVFTKQGGSNANLAAVIDTDVSTAGWIILNGSYEID